MIFLYSFLVRIKKFIFSIIIFSFLVESAGFAQHWPSTDEKKHKMEKKKENFNSFSSPQKTAYIDQWKFENKGKFEQHPEFGIMPFNAPNGDLVEILSKRAIDYRYYVNPKQPSKFFIQQSLGDLHFNKDGQLITIDHHISNKGNGIFAYFIYL